VHGHDEERDLDLAFEATMLVEHVCWPASIASPSQM